MVVLVGSSGRGAGMLVARVDRVCMQHGQSKQLAHLGNEKGHCQQHCTGPHHSHIPYKIISMTREIERTTCSFLTLPLLKACFPGNWGSSVNPPKHK